MEDTLISKILRFVFTMMIVMVIAAVLVIIVGLLLKWKTPVQFSNGFFFGGDILIMIGLVNVMGAKYQEGTGISNYNPVNRTERDFSLKLMMEDATRGQNFMAYMGTAGLLLFGVAWILTKV